MKGERTEVRRWRVNFDALERLSLIQVIGGPEAWVEVLEARPLIASLEQLADARKAQAAEMRETQRRYPPKSDVEIACGAAARAHEQNASELRSLIESLNQETDTNAD